MPHAVPLPLPDPAPHGRARPGAAAQVAGVVAFPVIGGVLAVSGMPVGDVLTLVSGCGAIGVAAVALASGRLPGAPVAGRLPGAPVAGRLPGAPVAGRLAGALAAAVRSAQEPRP